MHSRVNFKVVKYISYYPDPDAKVVDTFVIISNVISKIENRKIFTTQICFPRVAQLALSIVVVVDCQPVGKHPIVIRYLKGVFQARPDLPKYSFTLSAGKVIKHLSKFDISKLKDLATLLSLLCEQRARKTLCLWAICTTVIEHNICFIRIGDLLKTSGPNFHVGQLEYPAFSEDKSLCLVTGLW